MPRMNKRKRDEQRFGKAERLADLIHHARRAQLGVVVEATNVAEYYIGLMSKRSPSILSLKEDIPCARLPFDQMFVEAKRENLGRCRVGWGLASVSKNNDLALDAWTKNDGRDDFDRDWSSAVVGSGFAAWDGVAIHHLGLVVYHIDNYGRLAANPSFIASESASKLGEASDCDVLRFLTESLAPVLLALSFMHCKNVTLDAVDPDAALNRERRKAGLKPFVRYHTINIEPMKQVLRTEGGVEENGLKRALHICRGHFATYSDSFMGRPLAEPMTVWRPAHVRGQASEGVVFKDYRVSAPGQEGTA